MGSRYKAVAELKNTALYWATALFVNRVVTALLRRRKLRGYSFVGVATPARRKVKEFGHVPCNDVLNVINITNHLGHLDPVQQYFLHPISR